MSLTLSHQHLAQLEPTVSEAIFGNVGTIGKGAGGGKGSGWLARRVLDAIPDGAGVAMLDGKMQDDATWKQAKVIVDLADQIAAKDG